MNHQVHESTRFAEQHHGDIEKTTLSVLDAGRRFLAGGARSVLGDQQFGIAESMLANRDLWGFFLQIRPRAAEFGAGMSETFWHLVDAINMLSDAVGTSWPYMTEAKREQSLVWAMEHAAEV